jgi:hypothetical protein
MSAGGLRKVKEIEARAARVGLALEAARGSVDFGLVYGLLRRLLDARDPGAAAWVEGGLMAWESGGEAGFVAYLAGVKKKRE